MHEYKATVTKVVDGDTLILDIDLGFSVILHKQKVRLARINTPELNTEEGKLVRQILNQTLLNKEIIIQTIKDQKDKYGRFLVEILLENYNLNDWLLDHHYAKHYE